MNTENIPPNSIFYDNNNLDTNVATTSFFKKIQIKFSKKQQLDTKSSYLKKIDIGTPEMLITTNKNLQRITGIKLNNDSCNYIDIQNNNDHETNMVKNNQCINTVEVAPKIQITTNENLQQVADIKSNNNLCDFTDIQNNNDNKENMVKNNQCVNTVEIASNNTIQEPQRNKLLQDIRNFKANETLKKTKENNKENNKKPSLQYMIEKEIMKRRQFIDSKEDVDGDEYTYEQMDYFS